MRNRWKRTTRGLYSTLLFASAVSFLFQSWEIALVITISLGAHELGHILIVQIMGISWEFGFGPLGAWTKTPLERRQTIGHLANSVIHLAGPFFSFLLSILALVIYFLTDPPSRSFFWLRLANFSVLLAATNLLPIGSLSDGGKFVKRLVASLPQQSRTRLLLAIVPLIVINLEHLTDFDSAHAVSLLVFLLWFATSFFVNMRRGETVNEESLDRTDQHQFGILFSAMVMLVLYCLLIAIITPFWLVPDDVVHILHAFEAAVLYLILDSPTFLKLGSVLLVLGPVVGAGVVIVRWICRRIHRGAIRGDS
jgi:hypothetical protein